MKKLKMFLMAAAVVPMLSIFAACAEKPEPEQKPEPPKDYTEELTLLAAQLEEAQNNCNYICNITAVIGRQTFEVLRPLNTADGENKFEIMDEWGVEISSVKNGRAFLFKIGDAEYELGSDIDMPYNPSLRKVEDGENLNVLFIGNSLTADAVEHLPRMFKNMGISNVNLYAVYRGAFTLPRYVEVFDEPNSCALFYCEAGHDDWDQWDVTLDDCLKDILPLQTWDVISIQEHTGGEYAWTWTQTEKDAINSLIAKFNGAQPEHRPTIAYLFSHVYGNVFYSNRTLWDKFDGDNNKMYETCRGVVQNIVAETPVAPVIPCATAVQNLRTSTLNYTHPMDMSRDGVHSDKGITRFCEAATVFQTIFKPCLGVDLASCTYTYDVENTERGTLSTPVTEENRQIALQAANYAVEKPYEVTRMADPKPEDETVTYMLRLCDYYDALVSGLDDGNGTASLPAIGTPSNVSWTISAEPGPDYAKKEDGTPETFGKGLINGPANNRIKTGTASNVFSRFTLATTNLADKTITHVQVGLSTASKNMAGKVSIKVGDTPIVTDQDIALSTTAVKNTGFPYGADCEVKGNVEIDIHDIIDTKTVFYFYTVSITYSNK